MQTEYYSHEMILNFVLNDYKKFLKKIRKVFVHFVIKKLSNI